jgi:putative transposase
MTRPGKPRGPYPKAGDGLLLLGLIRHLVDEGLSCGYRRVTRLVNRRQKAESKPNVNAKRVLQIMSLERHTGHRPGRTHDGVVIALRPMSAGAPITSIFPAATAR